MSAEAESKPVGNGWPVSPPETGWSWKKIFFLIAFAFAGHLAFIFIFSEKKTSPPRVAANVPQLQLADNASELIALDDPTLFALPHVADFAPAIWRRPPAIPSPSFRWTEAPAFLAPAGETLGTAFGAFVESNRVAAAPLNFKPEPQLTIPEVSTESMLPPNSRLEISGELTRRKLLTPIVVPTLPYNDVIPPTKVQLLVDDSGHVLSAAPLESSGYELADQTALKLAATARFEPAIGLAFGEFIFSWHTVPTNAP
jgi:TonB family protein